MTGYDKITSLDKEINVKLKQSLLQYAIQGKLVPQVPNDEPVSVLLERIRAEKEQLIKEGKIKRVFFDYAQLVHKYYVHPPLNLCSSF